MSFSCPIVSATRHGLATSRVDIDLVVIGSNGEVEYAFQFDTGCVITTVSEDVGALMGLPTGGTPVQVGGALGFGVGRLVPVVFRFPPDQISGRPRPAVSSTWVVVAGRTGIALLSLQEVHDRFYINTDDKEMYFTNR
jgi:hypothetical protein